MWTWDFCEDVLKFLPASADLDLGKFLYQVWLGYLPFVMAVLGHGNALSTRVDFNSVQDIGSNELDYHSRRRRWALAIRVICTYDNNEVSSKLYTWPVMYK